MILFLLCAATLLACGGEDNGGKLMFRERSDGTYSVYWKGESTGVIDIPAYHDGKPVTAIEAQSFDHFIYLTEVHLPETLQVIGRAAFYHCIRLTEITLPSSLKRIGEYAFDECVQLSKINLSEVTDIGEGAFFSCYKLTDVTLNKNLREIKKETFKSCKISEIILPDSVTKIDGTAFSHCPIKKLTGRSDVLALMNDSFLSVLEEAILTGGESIADGFLKNVRTLKKLTVNGNVAEIGEEAFSGTYITEVVAPAIVMPEVSNSELVKATVTFGDTILKSSFSGCLKLEEVTLPQSVTKIKEKAFEGCKKLSALTLPAGLTEIGS